MQASIDRQSSASGIVYCLNYLYTAFTNACNKSSIASQATSFNTNSNFTINILRHPIERYAQCDFQSIFNAVKIQIPLSGTFEAIKYILGRGLQSNRHYIIL